MYNFNLPNWYEVVIHSFETHFSLLSQISSHAFFETPWIWIFIWYIIADKYADNTNNQKIEKYMFFLYFF